MSIQLQLLSIDLRGSELGHDIKFKGSMKDRGASVNGQAVSTFPPLSVEKSTQSTLFGPLSGGLVSWTHENLHCKRTLAFVRADGTDVNGMMIRQGFAWHYKSFNDSPELAEFETAARTAKVGLWGGSETPIPPWKFRKARK